MPKKTRRTHSTKGHDQYYVNTSEARQLDYLPNIYEPEKKKTRKVIKKTKLLTRYKFDIDKKLRYSFGTYAIISVIFLGAMLTIYFDAKMSTKSLSINNLYEKLRVLQEDNVLTKSELANSYNLADIEKIAQTRLGMSKPLPHQIIEIDVSDDGYLVRYDSEFKPETKENTIFSKLGNLFSGLISN